MEINQKWSHSQFLVLLDVGMTYDTSSSQFVDGINQIGATFYGSLFKHLTSISIWVSKDGKEVTLQTTGLMGNFAWGNSGGCKYLKLTGRARNAARRALEREWQQRVLENWMHPR